LEASFLAIQKKNALTTKVALKKTPKLLDADGDEHSTFLEGQLRRATI